MVQVINSIEFDQDKSEKYVMLKIYNREIDELREAMNHFEKHLRNHKKEKPDVADIQKMNRVIAIKRSVEEVWDKLRP